MKKLVRVFVILAVLALLGVLYALFGAGAMRAYYRHAAGQAMAAGETERAAGLYERVLDGVPRDETLRLLTAELYAETGNYSRAEYILYTGLRDVGPSVALYRRLCAVYVEQDKLLDAVELLDGIRSPGTRDEIERLRPAPPVFSLEEGRYGERVDVSLQSADTIYVSWTGEVPSAAKDLYTVPVTLQPGVTAARAVAVGSGGLVSVWADRRYVLENIVDPIVFEDPAVERVIRASIDRPGGQLYTSDLWSVAALVWDAEADYTTLNDLLYCPNLKELLLVGDRTRCDVSALKSLTGLTSLSLTAFGIDAVDLEDIAPLTNLETLWLADNNIGSVAALEPLGRLTDLNLQANSVLDVAPLGRLTSLRILSLEQNAVQDLNGLETLAGLLELRAGENRVISLRGLEALTALEVIDVSYNPGLTSLEELARLTSLRAISAAHCGVEKLPDFSGLSSLSILDIDANAISDLKGLPRGLVSLRCAGNGIESLEPLANCASLQTLDASHNAVSSVLPLGGLLNLESVRVEYNGIRTLLPLLECPALKEVYAFNNPLDDPIAAFDGTRLAGNVFRD